MVGKKESKGEKLPIEKKNKRARTEKNNEEKKIFCPFFRFLVMTGIPSSKLLYIGKICGTVAPRILIG